MKATLAHSTNGICGKRKRDYDAVEIQYLPIKKLKFEKTEMVKVAKGAAGSVPYLEVFVFSQLCPTPDPVILQQVRTLIEKGKLSQKRIAKMINASQTKISQYMNGSQRVKGWQEFEEKLVRMLNRIRKEQGTTLASLISDSDSELADSESQESGSAPSPSEVSFGDSECLSPSYFSDSNEAPQSFSFDEPDPWSMFSLNQMFM